MFPLAEETIFCSALVQMACHAVSAVCMRTQPEPFSPGRNLCYLTVLNLSHLCHFGHGQKWMEEFGTALLRDLQWHFFWLCIYWKCSYSSKSELGCWRSGLQFTFLTLTLSIFFISEVSEVMSVTVCSSVKEGSVTLMLQRTGSASVIANRKGNNSKTQKWFFFW